MWLPWRRGRAQAVAETKRAQAALSHSEAGVGYVETLARDMERIAEQNHLAPRIAEAFRTASPRKTGT